MTLNRTTTRTPAIIGDLIAGLVVFLVALPLCLGIAKASGEVPIMSGLIAGIVGGIVVGWLSGSHVSVSGPAAGLTAVVASQVAGLGSFEAFLAAVLLAGFLQICMGFARLGFFGAFFPTAVIRGLLAAIGLILILKQIPHLIGHDKDPEGEFMFQQPDKENTFSELYAALFDTHLGPLMVGLLCLALLVFWDRQKKLKSLPVPGALVVVVVGAVLGILFSRFGGDWTVGGDHLVQISSVRTLGEARDLLSFPDWTAFTRNPVWLAALTLAVVASLETLLNLDAADRLDPRKRSSPPNRELVAQGVGNMICGLIGGLPVTSVVVRTTVNINAGASSRLSAVVHGFLLLFCVLLIPGILSLIPLSALAAILLTTGFKLASPKVFREMWNRGWDQFLPFVVTIVAIVLTDLLIGILIGLAFSLFFILRSSIIRPLKLIQEKHIGGEVLRIELGSEVNFLNRAALQRTLSRVPRGSHVLLDARQTVHLDHDVQELLRDFELETAPAHSVQVSRVGFRDRYELRDRIQFVDFATRELQQLMTPDDVLQILRDGNERFRSGNQLLRDLGRQMGATSTGQFPLAVLLGCIDSRTPAEMVFDLGLGEIFSVRIAGNVADHKVLGSIEYACAVAGAKLIVVKGHTSCGAVNASVRLTREGKTALEAVQCENIDHLIVEISKSIPRNQSIPDPVQSPDVFADFVDRIARLNTVRTMNELMQTSGTLRNLVQSGKVRLVGCMYDVRSGMATFFDTQGNDLPVPATVSPEPKAAPV